MADAAPTRPPRPAATVRDIAAATGVSIATVSRVLNGHPNVAPETRELVQRTADRLGTRTGQTSQGAIYLRCPYTLTDYFGLIVSSIAESLEPHQRTLILDAGEISQSATVLPGLATRPGVAGAIMILPPEPDDQLLALRAQGFPFVVVDPRSEVPRDIAAVSAAHLTGARSATHHLLAAGHRRIGVIAGPEEWLAARDRLAGHASALADAGILPDRTLIRSIEPTVRLGHWAATELLDLPDPPTALVCFNDKTAIGAMSAATERGLRVPRDLSITGFDDIDLAQAANPMLTTVRQPLAEMGRMAVSLLIRLIDRRPVDALHVELATELVVRGSTAAPRSGRRRPSRRAASSAAGMADA